MNLRSPIDVKIEWKRQTASNPFTLSISAFLLNKKGVVNKMEDFVFYGNRNNGTGTILNSNNSVRCDALNIPSCFNTENAYRMALNLNSVRQDVNHIRLIVSVVPEDYSDKTSSFENISNAKFTFKDSGGFFYQSELNHNVEPDCRCIEICLVQRFGNSWRFYEEKVARIGGLELPYDEYTNHLAGHVPFSEIGDIAKIEWRFEEPAIVTGKNDTKNGTKITTRKKSPGPQKEKDKDDFFVNDTKNSTKITTRKKSPGPQKGKDKDDFFVNGTKNSTKITTRKKSPGPQKGKDKDDFFVNDTKNGTKITTREKSPDPQKGKMQSQPGAENMEQDPFFKKSDSEKVEKKTTKEDFSFGDANNVPHQSNGKQDRDPFFNN